MPTNVHNSRLLSHSQQLRKEMTKEERHLWYDFLKLQPFTVHRQKVFGHYIVDFYIASAKIVIELDGSQHYEDENRQKDQERDAFLAELGIASAALQQCRCEPAIQQCVRGYPAPCIRAYNAFSLRRRWQAAGLTDVVNASDTQVA